MHTAFSELSSLTRTIERSSISGQVTSALGLVLTVSGLERAVGIGAHCLVQGREGPVLAEVVGIDSQGTRLLPFGSWDGVRTGDPVQVSHSAAEIRPDDAWIGRVVNALGQPLDGKGRLPEGDAPRKIRAAPPPAFERRRVGERLNTKVKVMDVFTPLCRGQRMGVFAGSGVGKSTMMAMLARGAQADVIVVGLVGERGREVQDFLQEDLGEEGMARSVVVVSTGDEPPLMRRQAAWTATAVAEHFRDQGKQVLLLLDSVTRFAMAQREIGLAGGEPPTSKGYPPTTFAELPRMMERAGPGSGSAGDITALYTVLVDGGDMEDPIADAVRGIMDGHIVLDRKIAEQGRFPAVNLLRSISRMLPDCHNEDEYAIYRTARRAAARYADMEELIRIGAYRHGSDEEVDTAIALAEPLDALLSQRKHEAMESSETFARLHGALSDAGIVVG
ncbi:MULTISPECIES: flagellar protein export ATPase FliI [Roseobacteraceae]|uniref:flagellar protein export ATPase FliI n=1 Tax=Roseobacteraceae TaxID=2854170 RepID=UPI00080AB12F|nr:MULTISPECIES: flagellar protein export ATPase FliI [Roseobacteraceae]ANT63277.1 flagellar protein export ATPase FliI [Salipiger sp. CCB-MM3]MCA0994801.1 flagellar protein export ATPase FliI [Alloyangia pacifica]NDW00454.1 flagellar protein export ATPase FliI [Salipiger sp. PrR002]NDW56412.1 flagellar protein export ATPase FliI [Salipiger sp. PrR004]